MSELTATIDWLSGTFHDEADAWRFLIWLETDPQPKPCKPRFGYSWGNEYTSGLLVYASSERTAMGVHVIMSGSTLAYYIKAGKAVLAILEKFITNKGKCTRLDLALDLIDGGIDGKKIYEALQSGNRTGIATSSSLVLSGSAGCTVYVGSRQSDRFMRIYNKAAEQDVVADWYRLEIECKGDVAKEYARALVLNSTMGLGSFTWSTAKKMCYTEGGNYHMFGKFTSTVALPKIEKQSDTRKWILEQVIPALDNYLKERADDAQVIAELAELLYNVENNPAYKRSTTGLTAQ